MEKHSDWTDRIRDRFENEKVTPPADGWARLEEALSGSSFPTRQPRWMVLARRATTIAAVVALCLLSYKFAEEESLQIPTFESQIAMDEDRVIESETVIPTVVVAQLRQKVVSDDVLPLSVSTIKDTTPEESANKEPLHKPKKEVSEKSKSKAKRTSSLVNYTPQEPIEQPSKKQPISISFFASGGLGTRQSESPDRDVLMSSAPQMPEQGRLFSRLKSDYRQGTFRHHQPMSFGLSFRKNFRNGLSLETGINYTLLWSDIQMPYSDEMLTQKLQFLGLPIRINWNALEREHWVLYLSGGGMMEYCVDARLGSRTFSEPGLKWSLNGGIGVEYKLGRLVGLYFEPEISYYLNDTRFRTIRSDAPLSVTLRAGLRFNF